MDPLGTAARAQDRNAARDRGARPRGSSRGRFLAAAARGLGHDAVRPAYAGCRRGAHAIAAPPLTLVVDATVALPACLSEAGFGLLPDTDLVAPELMWSETRSTLHELVWRGEVTPADGEAALDALEHCAVSRAHDRRLGGESWRIADELGWAKTYDAEYVALARLLDCRVVTLDTRLRRGAERLNLVVTLDELT